MPETPVAVGELLLITSGDWSEYGVDALVRVLRPFDVAELERDYLDATRKGRRSSSALVAWLVARGVIEEVEYREVQVDVAEDAP